MEASIFQFEEFLHRTGCLHDCRISDLSWNPGKGRLEVRFQDLQANFLGLPEYSGPQPGCLVFNGVEEVGLDVAICDKVLRVYEALARAGQSSNEVEFRFSPAGKLVVRFATVSVETADADTGTGLG